MNDLVKTKIFKRQFLSYIVLILLIIVGILGSMTFITKKSLEKQMLKRTEISKEQVASEFRRYLNNRVNDVKSYGIWLQDFNGNQLRSARIHTLLEDQVTFQDNFHTILIIDESGKVVNSSLHKSLDNIQATDRDYFQNALQGISTVTGFLTSKISGELIMVIAEPIEVAGNSKYVLIGILGMEKIQRMIEDFTSKDVSKISVLDENHMLVSSNFYNEFTSTKFSDKAFVSTVAVDSLKAKKRGMGIYNDILNQKVMGAYEWIDSLNIGVVVERDYYEAMSAYTSLFNMILVISLALLSLSILLSFAMSLQIIRPLNIIIKAVQSFTNKRKMTNQERIEIDEDNELLNLVHAINTMQATILERENKLNELVKQLKEEKRYAAEASRLKSQFLANMSHELRTPLNSIIGFTRRIMKKCEDVLPEVHYENLTIVNNEAHHLLQIINNLLDYSKIEANKMDIYIEDFNLAEVVKEIEDIFKVTIENGNVRYNSKLLRSNMIISSDRTKIKQILLNLISNAFKYSDKGSITVEVSERNEMYLINVSDEGIGISQENLESIFEEFRQVDGSYTRKVGGTGLGLSITKKMTILLQGEIKVKSQKNIGSTFTVMLPKVYERHSIKESTLPKTSGRKLKYKIICIDDDIAMHRLYKQYFSTKEYDVLYLTGQEDVISIIENTMPKAVLLDILLPNKDGWDILAHIKSDTALKNITVVMVSVLDEKNIAYYLKADDYLVKPVLREELIEVIEKIDYADYREKDILIADDDNNFVSLAEQVLSEYVTDIRCVSDGEKAIESIKEKSPTILLLDIMMPKFNGFEVIDFMNRMTC